MRIGLWKFTAALTIGLLAACKGTITSPERLLTPANTSHPFPATAEIEGRARDDRHRWEKIEGKARLTLMDGAYRVTNPNEAAPTEETFLFRRIGHGLIVAQGDNGREWAYGLIVHSDRYDLFTFNREGQNCTGLSAAERARFGAVVQGDRCSVSNLRDLIGLLLYMRERFPEPTSVFTVRPTAQ